MLRPEGDRRAASAMVQVVFWYDVILVETSAAPVSEECFPDIHCAVPLYDRHD